MDVFVVDMVEGDSVNVFDFGSDGLCCFIEECGYCGDGYINVMFQVYIFVMLSF